MRVLSSTLAAALVLLSAGGTAAAVAKVGPNSQRPEPSATCTAYPGVDPDIYGRVYRVPKTNCDVADMTIAVRGLGTFRSVYDPRPASARVGGSILEISADEAIEPVIKRLRDQARLLAPGKPLKILIFAHGGLVSHDNALASAESLAPAILADGFQPVFLVWNSDFWTSYRDRLCCVRDGLQDDEFSPVSTVGRFGGDVAAGAVRSPQNFGGQMLRFRDSVITRSGTKYYLIEGEERATHPEGMCAALNGLACPTLVFPAYANEAELNGRARSMGREINYTLLAPVRGVATLVGPEIGANAWHNMVRRTRMPFQRTAPVAAPGADCANQPDPESVAGFAVFFDRLACELGRTEGRWVDSEGGPVSVEIHMYGHSMGALVANEAMWLHPELPWTEVTYMAAASTIRDFRMTAVPTLSRHPGTKFYNLVLHPLNESRELFKGGLAPQGSLLEWIDEMFEGPRSPDERTLGKWNNLRTTMALIPADVRTRMTIRVFAKSRDAGTECGLPPNGQKAKKEDGRCHPVVHGEFNEFSFWRRSYLDGLAR